MKKLFPIIMFCMSMMLPLVSCTNLDETNQRLDDLEYQVTDLQSTLKVLSDAFNEGKQIKDYSKKELNGWTKQLMTCNDLNDNITLSYIII